MGSHLEKLFEESGSERGVKLVEVGLIVNPIAGIGGKVGLKGSDGSAIQRQAYALGAKPTAQERSCEALQALEPLRDRIRLITCSGDMGGSAAEQSGFKCTIVRQIEQGKTTASDTKEAALRMAKMGVRLILFAGGDGTARNVASAVRTTIPAVGIPAGVKMHSAVFSNTPRAAGELVSLMLKGRVSRFHEAEVMDLDETAYRCGEIKPRLYGYLKVPMVSGLIQSRKRPAAASDAEAQAAMAAWFSDNLERGCMYVLGPGTTTRQIAAEMRLAKTLIGVDVIKDRELVASDINEDQLLAILEGERAMIVVTPIGGQGHLFGRGNQQISSAVIETVGIDNIMVVCGPEKLHSLTGRPMLVDSGDPAVDAMLSGWKKVIVGYDEQAVYRVKG